LALILFLLTIYGISKVKTNIFFLDDLSNKSSLKQELNYFEKAFSGIRPFEFAVTSVDTPLSYENIFKLEEVERFLLSHYNLGMIQSPVQVLKHLNKSLHGGSQNHFIIPKDKVSFNKLIKAANRLQLFDKVTGVYDKNSGLAKISGRGLDMGSSFYEKKNRQFDEYFKTTQITGISIQQIGLAYLIDQANAEISSSFIKGMGFVVILLIVVVYAISSSWRITIISLLVNSVPLLVTGGIMGIMEIPLKVSTALTFSIVMGIAVDDTIHFIHKYLQYKRDYSIRKAISLTLTVMVKPLISTSVILFIGFMILGLSSFQSIQVMGILTSFSLLVALATDLLLLPYLLNHFDIKKVSDLNEGKTIPVDQIPSALPN